MSIHRNIGVCKQLNEHPVAFSICLSQMIFSFKDKRCVGETFFIVLFQALNIEWQSQHFDYQIICEILRQGSFMLLKNIKKIYFISKCYVILTEKTKSDQVFSNL
jgi:hypothetical protein